MWKTFKLAGALTPAQQVIALLNSPLLDQNKVFLWCLENNQQVKTYADLLKNLQKLYPSNKQILVWPHQTEAKLDILTALFNNQPAIILTTADNLNTPVLNWDYLKNNQLYLKAGQNIDLNQLNLDLNALGLSREAQAWEENTFSIRGSLVDIYQNHQLYRFNVWDNKLEDLQAINPWQIDEITKIETFSIFPLNLPYKYNLAEHLPNFCGLIFEQNLSTTFSEFVNPQIIFDSLSSPRVEAGKKIDETLYFTSIKNQLLSTQEKNDLLLNKTDWQIIIFSQNLALSKHFFSDLNIKYHLVDWRNSQILPSSFSWPAKKILVLNENLFFLQESITKQSNIQEQFALNFDLGDLIVHRDHGVGILKKIETLNIDEQNKEYLVLAYAENDTLFVPIELADKVEKYLGPTNPKIHRLSIGNTWPQTLKKIKENTLVLANQLLTVEATRKLHTSPKITPSTLAEQIAHDFPYTLTKSQNMALLDIWQDFKSGSPSDRLICGDVGFGKTEVALRAATAVIENGWQVAILCPTTILAQQHYDNFINRLEKYGVKIALLSRWQSQAEIKNNITKIKNCEIDIVIATHRLLSRDVHLPKLQLLIIDEEQNFGVKDKEKIKKHQSHINLLTLSATPIPRTLNMALSMIKDISLISDPIANRHDIITQIAMSDEEIIQAAIAKELERSGQVYFLHNKVATINFALTKIKKLFPLARVALAHGQLDDKTLADTMHAFDTNQIDILVCSTIIANGLDIANANTLIVTEADKFGLSQLHQLRGRIGRSAKQAYAYFLYSVPKLKTLAARRLGHLKLASALGDGFKIANYDLELRGVGQILGKAQSGKVKSIGLGLYQQLIAETIAELKGQILKPWRDVEIKLNLDLNLPKTFFNSIAEKLSFYQDLTRIKDLEIIAQKIKDTENKALKNILHLQAFRILCQKTDITSIQEYKNRDKEFISFNFLNILDYKKLEKLLSLNPAWKFTEQQIKIEKNQLNKNIIQAISELIKFWQK